MSNTSPTTRAVANTIAKATTSISPPTTWRSIERATSRRRGCRPTTRTSQRSSASGSTGSGAPDERDSAPITIAATTAATRTASVTDIGRQGQSAPVSRCRGAETAQNRPYRTRATAAKPTRRAPSVEPVASRSAPSMPLASSGRNLIAGVEEEPPDQAHDDAATGPSDAAERDDRLVAERADVAWLELVAELRPEALDQEVQADADEHHADGPDQPASARLLHQLPGVALDLGVLALGAGGGSRSCWANCNAVQASAEYTRALTR